MFVTTHHAEWFVQRHVLDIVADEFSAPLPRVQFRIRQRTSSDSRRHEFLHTDTHTCKHTRKRLLAIVKKITRTRLYVHTYLHTRRNCFLSRDSFSYSFLFFFSFCSNTMLCYRKIDPVKSNQRPLRRIFISLRVYVPYFVAKQINLSLEHRDSRTALSVDRIDL